MFHKKTLLTLLVFGLVLTAGIGITSAFTGNWPGKWDGQRPVFDEEKHQAMLENHQAIQEAIENNDYATWLELMNDCPIKNKITEIITEENFDKFVEMHQFRKDGDFEAAQAIAEELGLPGMGGRLVQGKFRPAGRFMKDFRLEDKNGDGFCDAADLEVE